MLLFYNTGTSIRTRIPNLLVSLTLWLLMITVLQWAFIGMVRAMLTIPRPVQTIDTMDDMIDAIENRQYWWAAKHFDNIYNVLRDVNNPKNSYSERDLIKLRRLKKVSNITPA